MVHNSALPEDWAVQLVRVYSTFGIRRIIPDIPHAPINPEFEKEHPRGEGGTSGPGQFIRKPDATIPEPEPRADLDHDPRADGISYDTTTAQRAASTIENVVAHYGLNATSHTNEGTLWAVLLDSTGKRAGHITTQYKDDTAIHDEIIFNPEHQGKGMGTELQMALEALYRARGIPAIELTANIDVGGYTWAKLGYEFKNMLDAMTILRKAERMVAADTMEERQRALEEAQQDLKIWEMDPYRNENLREYVHGSLEEAQDRMGRPPPDPAIARKVASLRKRIDNGDTITPVEFAMIGRIPGATTWFGKNLTLGTYWKGRKRL